jgi:hypothetical protein
VTHKSFRINFLEYGLYIKGLEKGFVNSFICLPKKVANSKSPLFLLPVLYQNKKRTNYYVILAFLNNFVIFENARPGDTFKSKQSLKKLSTKIMCQNYIDSVILFFQM